MKIEQRFIEWLGSEGVKFFQDLVDKYGTVLALWNEGIIPHPVHFREGMQVRNWMRDQEEFKDKLYDDHWFDNNWYKFTEECIKGKINK